MDIESIRSEIRSNRYKKNKQKKNNKFSYRIFTFLILIILTLTSLIVLRTNPNIKDTFYEVVYNNNFSFAKINSFYQEKFGSIIPFFKNNKSDIKQVFNEKLEYTDYENYLDGVKLNVSSNYMVPILESGLVVFIGEKDGYGKTVIVQQIDGVDTWYGNIDTTSVKLYDYIEKGNLLGECSKNLYLVFKKDGKKISYEDKI